MAGRKSNRGRGVKRAASTRKEAASPDISLPKDSIVEDIEAANQQQQEMGDSQTERMKTRQDTNPERRLAIQRLMDAIREGDFDSDLGGSSSDESAQEAKSARVTRAKKAQLVKRRKQHKQKPKGVDDNGDSDSDYVQIVEEEEEEEEEEAEGEEALDDSKSMSDQDPSTHNGSDKPTKTKIVSTNADEQQLRKKKEKRLMLKFKMANLARTNGTTNNDRQGSGGLQLEDIDWSEFDLETINAILARREELRKKRHRAVHGDSGVKGDDEITTAKLKKSSLAPAPLRLERTSNNDESAGVWTVNKEGQEQDMDRAETMDVDEGDRPDLHYLFGDPIEPLSPGGSSLQLPPRASAIEGIAEHTGPRRPHPAFIRAIPDHAGTPKDMRIVLQYELKSEERLLKDIRAEIVDKLFKLQAEEKLLRMAVKKDFELDDEQDVFSGPGDVEHQVQSHEPVGAMEVDNRVGSASDSDDSLSGMSSSSEDEVPDDELTRGALSRVIMQYLPEDDQKRTK
ncbi:hypothetical protein BX070DRAFT_96830 [Coemansia spiralis]|nr:hypothetical protein BX070DRAFT_96830 [Coemansia spiralis]